MADRMDQVIAAAVRQGFTTWQDARGAWYFRKGIATLNFRGTPRTAAEWQTMLGTLRGAGLVFPERE